jgi:hypothetical protein
LLSSLFSFTPSCFLYTTCHDLVWRHGSRSLRACRGTGRTGAATAAAGQHAVSEPSWQKQAACCPWADVRHRNKGCKGRISG